MSENDVVRALKALADADRGEEASEVIEAKLKAAFRKRYKRRLWPYFSFAATVFLGSFGIFLISKPAATLRIPAAPSPPAPIVALTPAPKRVVNRQTTQPQEVVTEFYPLLDNPPPFERGELLRVSVPASAMRTVGLPVSEERLNETVQADVLVGEEGLARAIRFVNTSVNRP